MGAAAAAVAGDAEVQRALQDAFQLEAAVMGALLALIVRGGPVVLALEDVPHFLAGVDAVDQQEVPGLHEAHGRGVVGSLEQARQYVGGDGVGQELGAHVPAFVDGAVEAGFLGFAEAVAFGHGRPW